MAEAIAHAAVSQAVTAQMTMLASMIPADKAEETKKEALAAGLAAVEKDVAGRLSKYQENKEKADAAAFALMDTNGDGTVQLDEFMACFKPKSEKQDGLMLALGFITEQEKFQQDQMRKLIE